MAATRPLQSTGRDARLPRGAVLSGGELTSAIDRANDTLATLDQSLPFLFELLGMRNLSAFVGELVNRQLAESFPDLLRGNPHQDGYPDLLLMDGVGQRAWQSLQDRLAEKEPFSPFPSGGVETKATCGDVPSAKVLTARGLAKPQLRETRRELLQSMNWKAHHRETNHLLGLLWDFVDGHPFVVAAMYSDALTPDHWGRIVQPRAGGGKTTSVSIMNRAGVRLMARGLLAVDRQYEDFVSRRAA